MNTNMENAEMKDTNVENAHIKTFHDRFEKSQAAGRGLAAPYAEKSLERFARLCAERLNDLNPKLMVYGIYNADKSTLVNALMGGEYAPVGDVPTTKANRGEEARLVRDLESLAEFKTELHEFAGAL